MSIIFYDKFIAFKDLEKIIKKKAQSTEERQELWAMVEEVIHHRVVGCCLDNLPREHHQDFLDRFYKAPHSGEMLAFLRERIKKDMEQVIKGELSLLMDELKKLISG